MLNKTDIKILIAIEKHMVKSSIPPCQSEIAKDIGLTKQAVSVHIAKLEKGGYVSIESKNQRLYFITIVKKQWRKDVNYKVDFKEERSKKNGKC